MLIQRTEAKDQPAIDQGFEGGGGEHAEISKEKNQRVLLVSLPNC